MHTLNPITKGLWLALLLAGGTASEHLLAADAAENDAGKTEPSLKTVTVTAQHREETLQEVPVAVSAVQGTSIIADGVRSMGDITTFIPNASAKTRRRRAPALVHPWPGHRRHRRGHCVPGGHLRR